MLARFEEAALDTKSRRWRGAHRDLRRDRQGRRGSIRIYRDLATLLAARYELDKQDPKAAVDRLQPLTDAANPWHPTALELTARRRTARPGDKAGARANAISASPTILPRRKASRARAAEMVAALGQ